MKVDEIKIYKFYAIIHLDARSSLKCTRCEEYSCGLQQTNQPRSELEDCRNCTNFTWRCALLRVSAHTLPPMRLLCSSFISSLAGQHSLKNHSKSAENFKHNDDDAEDNASDLSENEVLPPMKPAVTPTNEKEDIDEDANVQLTDHDWSFLSTILPEQDNVL